MRKALVPAFLLVLGAAVLGATVFREQLVHAATTPFQQVLVQNTSTNPVPVQQVGTSTTNVSGTVGIDNTSTNPVPVQQVGTSTTNVSGTVGIDPSNNTVKLDPSNNAVTLGVTPVTALCRGGFQGDLGGIGAGQQKKLCSTSGSWDISTIVAQGMDDNVDVDFYDGTNNLVLELNGGGADGTSVYQLNLPRPLRATEVWASCYNLVTNCGFTLNVLGTSNP
jgi:hypothetical protein